MKSYYCGITNEGTRDIKETREGFQVSRQVFGGSNIIDNKEQTLKAIPYCSVLDSLERELKDRVNNILEEDMDCMTDINGLNME